MTDEMLTECLRKDSSYITELVNADSESLDIHATKQMLVNIQTNILRAAHALELLSNLTDRPCDACRFKTENGCERFECVFKGV